MLSFEGLTAKDLLALAVSGAALIVSLFTLWVNRLAPFSLRVAHTGRLYIWPDAFAAGAVGHAIGAQFLFSNVGAGQGYLNDIAIAIAREDQGAGPPALLRAHVEQLEEPLNLQQGAWPPPKLHAFTAFGIKPGETEKRRIVFRRTEFPDEPLILRPGLYRITPFTRDSRRPNAWRRWRDIHIDLTTDEMALVTSTVTPDAGGGQYVQLREVIKISTEGEDAIRALVRELRG